MRRLVVWGDGGAVQLKGVPWEQTGPQRSLDRAGAPVLGGAEEGGLSVHAPLLLLLLLLSRFSCVRLCATPQTAAHQAPPSLGFSRQEHWRGLPFPSPMHESEK